MKKLSLFVLAIIVVGSLILVSCSNATSSSAAPATTTKAASTAPVSTVTVTPTLQPKYGGTLIWMEGPSGVDNPGGWPWTLVGPQSRSPQLVIEPLLRGNGKGGVQPWLAQTYKLADDHLSITFNLRTDVKFHDGTPFNAQAAKWNLDNAIAAKTSGTTYWKSVDVISDYTIRVNFTQWVNTNWGSFADGVASWMVSPTAFNLHGKDWMLNNPVGTGPFKFVSFQRDVSYKTVKNPDYWGRDAQGNKLPYLDAFNVNYVTDVMTQLAAMKAGEADITANPDTKTASEYVAAGFKTAGAPDTIMNMFLDTANADSPYSKKAAREAVEYAINKEAMAKALSYGFWEAPYQILGAASPYFDPNYTGARKYDPNKAKTLLASAGYPNGFKTTLLTCTLFGLSDIMANVQSDLSKVGIQAQIAMDNDPAKFNQDTNVLISILATQPVVAPGNANSALAWWFNPNPTIMLKNWMASPEYTELYNKSISSPEPDKSLIQACTNYMQSEATVIPLVGGLSMWVYAPYVMNGGWNERGSYISIKAEQMWLNK